MTPLRRATSDLTVNVGSLRTVLCVRLVVLLLLVMTTIVFLVLLVEAVVHLLTETTTMAEHTSFTFFAVTAKSSRTFFTLLELALLWWVLATLLRSTCGIWESEVSGGFVGVLLIINEVPALCEVRAEILDDWTAQAKRYV